MAKILLVEDDAELAESLVGWLEMEKHTVEHISSGEDALQMLENYRFDVIVLDWGLPDMSGYEVLKKYRQAGGAIPIIFLTGRNDVESKALGLDGGADDYLAKPFDVLELSARIRSLLRRPAGFAKLEIGNVCIESGTKKVSVSGQDVHLTHKEYAILDFLLRHSGQVFASRALMDAVWPSDVDSSEDTVRQTMRNLRRKITVEGEDCIIKTVLGAGYTVKSEAADKPVDV